MNEQQRLIVITGVQASGKTTVARALAKRFPRSVHIEADQLQRMILSGGVWPTKPEELEEEASAQLRLRLKNMCLLGRSFFDEGFTVVMDEIIIGDRWYHLQDEMTGYAFSLFVLAPSIDKVIQRDHARDKHTLGKEWAHYLDTQLRDTMADKGSWLDTSHQTVEEVVKEILDMLQRS